MNEKRTRCDICEMSDQPLENIDEEVYYCSNRKECSDAAPALYESWQAAAGR